jgi:four helix bundle protein
MEAGKYSFEDLEVYKSASDLRKRVYSLIKMLPDVERFNLQSQMRRAALSITNNIAESHGRFHFQDKARFLLQSRGSLEELIDDFNVCMDERYVGQEELRGLKEQSYKLLKQLNGYIAYLRNQKLSSSSN